MALLNAADAVYLGATKVDRIYLGSTLVWSPPPPPVDSFVTADTVGPLPWWETGGPTHQVQTWAPPYKHGFAFRTLADVLVLGARIWRPSDNGNVADGAPELCLSNAVEWDVASHHTSMVAAAPATSGWVTVTFPAPAPVAAGTEKLLWITNPSGTVAVTLARQAGRFPTPTLSRLGLLESLAPSAWYDLPAIGTVYEAPLSHTDAWYWIDPLVTAA